MRRHLDIAMIGAERAPAPVPDDVTQAPAAQLVLVPPGGGRDEWATAGARWPGAWRVPVVPCRPDATVVAPSALCGVLYGSPVAVVVLGAGGVPRSATPALARMLGYSDAADLLAEGASWWCAGDADGLGRARRADGELISVEAEGWAIRFEDGEALALCLRDVTAAQEAHLSLRRTSAWHRTLVENAHDAIAILDRRGTILYQSPASFELLGIPADELVGQQLQVPDEEDAVAVAEVFRRVCHAPGTSLSIAYRLQHADGSLRWIESSFTNHLDDPAVEGIVVNSRDVTEARAATQALHQAEMLRVAGLVGATVAHDLKNMLSVVGGGLDVLEDLVPPEARAGLATMRAALARSGNLARRLTVYGRTGDETRVVDASTVITELEGLLRQVLGPFRRLDVQGCAEPALVEVSVSDLEQAVINLVGNARDALAEGGRVVVSVACRGDQVEVAVEDDGTGMSEDVRARVFEPGFTTKDAARGSGLGMLVVEGFVRGAGGRVEVRSRPGEGTRVAMILRAVERA